MHRNRCQDCFKNTGRFILDCYCILCEACYGKRDKNSEQCNICRQRSKHNCIDVQDRSNISKMSYLFSNLEFSFNRCIEAYKFQASIDAKYCKFLENQLTKYKEAIGEIVVYNPQLKDYFDNKLVNNKSKHRSSSEYIPNHPSNNNQPRNDKQSQQSLGPRSMSTSSVIMQHERLVDPQRLGANADRNYSGKVNYKMPNINYNTALRSSKRPTQRDEDDHNFYPRHNR